MSSPRSAKFMLDRFGLNADSTEDERCLLINPAIWRVPAEGDAGTFAVVLANPLHHTNSTALADWDKLAENRRVGAACCHKGEAWARAGGGSARCRSRTPGRSAPPPGSEGTALKSPSSYPWGTGPSTGASPPTL